MNVVIVLQSQVFAVSFALLAAGAVILTLNVLLLVINLSISLSRWEIRAKLISKDDDELCEFVHVGWAHYLLPEPEPRRLLHRPS